MAFPYKLSLLSIALFLVSCTVGPDYVRPAAVPAMPAKFKEAKGKAVIGKKNTEWAVAVPKDQVDRGEWWKIFNEPVLNSLETELNRNNQSIVTAEANYLQALALVDEARASYFPTLSTSATLTRQRQASSGSSSFVSTSSNGTTSSGAASTGGSSSASNGKAHYSTSHAIIFNASWEPDIWGLVHRTEEAAASGAQSIEALLNATKLSSQASLAQYYFELRSVDTDQKLLDQTVANYKKALKFTNNQYKSGVAAQSDVVLAKTQLETAQAQAITNGINRALYEHAIAVLIGQPASVFSLPAHPLTRTAPPIPLILPSTMLERRPDVAQAERLMAQANANIGVAVAAYFPTFSLVGTASSSGQNLGHWFSMPTLNWAFGPQLAETILDGGLRAATVAAAKAGYQSTVASYRQIVLATFQDVEDNLATLRILESEVKVQKAAARDAELSLQLITNQYKAGTVAYSNVITAQTTAFTAQKTAYDAMGLQMTAAVGLIKALGGTY